MSKINANTIANFLFTKLVVAEWSSNEYEKSAVNNWVQITYTPGNQKYTLTNSDGLSYDEADVYYLIEDFNSFVEKYK